MMLIIASLCLCHLRIIRSIDEDKDEKLQQKMKNFQSGVYFFRDFITSRMTSPSKTIPVRIKAHTLMTLDSAVIG